MATCQEQMDALSARFIELQKELCRVRLNSCRMALRDAVLSSMDRNGLDEEIQKVAVSMAIGSPCTSRLLQIEQALGLDE